LTALSQSTNLYIEFWTSIRSTNENQEDVAKLNDLGTKINNVVEVIKTNFDSMQKLKHNDELVIRLYSDFLLDILNEKEKGLYYKNRLNEIEGSNDDIQVQNDKNIDLDHLLSDEFQYIMITADADKPNIIKKITTGICSLFGYAKDELIGQPLDVLMPEQYQKLHKKILTNKLDEYKKFIANNLHSKTKKTYKSTYKEIFAVAKNKSKYLIPISIKSSLITSADLSEIYFIGKCSKVIGNNMNNKISNTNSNPIPMGGNSSINNMANQPNVLTTDNVCYVLTDNNFVVQNFSANSIFLMGLKAKYNGNLDITRHIKELYEDFDFNKLIENSYNNNINVSEISGINSSHIKENLNNDYRTNKNSKLNNINNINSSYRKELMNSLNKSKRTFLSNRYRNPVKINWRFPAKLKEKVAFMANIISINERNNNPKGQMPKPSSRKNSDKSVSSQTQRPGIDEPSPRSNREMSQDLSNRQSKLSSSHIRNIKGAKDIKEGEYKKKQRIEKNIDFAAYVQEPFLLSVIDVFLLGNLQGFIFKFEPAFVKNNTSGLSNLSQGNNRGRKSDAHNNQLMNANININFNFNSNTRNMTTSMQYSIDLRDTVESINPNSKFKKRGSSNVGSNINNSSGNIHNNNYNNKEYNRKGTNKLLDLNVKTNNPTLYIQKQENKNDIENQNNFPSNASSSGNSDRQKKQIAHDEIPISINFVKNPTFSENQIPLSENHHYINLENNNNTNNKNELVIDNLKNHDNLQKNPFINNQENVESEEEKKQNKEKSLGATNWIRNIRRERIARKKQMREMKDLKIDKNYLPQNSNEFHLDPKIGVYKINPKNPENFVEYARQAAEEKITVEEPFKEESNSGSDSESDSESNYSSSDKSRSNLSSVIEDSEKVEENKEELVDPKVEINESVVMSKKNMNNSIFNSGINNSINLKNDLETEGKLNRAKNLYDLNIMNSSEFENSKIQIQDDDFDINSNNYGNNITFNIKTLTENLNESCINNNDGLNKITSNGFKNNLNAVNTNFTNKGNKSGFLNNDKTIISNNTFNKSLLQNKHSSAESADSSYRSDGSKNPEANNKKNMMFINASSNKISPDMSPVYKEKGFKFKNDQDVKKFEQPKLLIPKKSKKLYLYFQN